MAYTRTAPNTFLPVAQGGTTVKQGIINDDTDIKYILGILSGLSTGKVPYRQTVLTGAVGSDGQPSFLVPSGLYVSIAAAAKSLLLSFAAGYGADGYPVDYLSAVSADVANAWNLPPTQTVYLYIDRDASTGTLTYGYTTLEPSYSTSKPTNPVSGQFWYSSVLQYAQVYNGSSWDIRQRLYVAKAVSTDAAATLTYLSISSDAMFASLLAQYNTMFASLLAQYNTLFGLTFSEKMLMVKPGTGYVSPLMELTRNGTIQQITFYPQGTVSAATSVYVYTGDGTVSLTSSLTNSATTMVLNKAITFTGTPYAIIDANGTPEIVQMTAGSGTTSITIVRGQIGTSAAAHSAGGVLLPNIGSVSISTNTPASLSIATTGTKRDLFVYSTVGTGLINCNITAVQEWVNR